MLFEQGVRLQERGHRAVKLHSLFFGAWQSVAAKFPTPPLAPLLSDRLEAEPYGLRYGGLAPCSKRQLPTVASGFNRKSAETMPKRRLGAACPKRLHDVTFRKN